MFNIKLEEKSYIFFFDKKYGLALDGEPWVIQATK